MSTSHTAPVFTLTDTTALTFAGPTDRYHKNLAALQLLRSLQAAQRSPDSLSDAERLTLAHYTAFGDSALLRRAFGGTHHDLDGLLSPDEEATIKRTALTAFYTSLDVLHAQWAALTPALAQLPTPLRVLEPAFGIGLYAATMPLALRARAQITAVELDLVSSQIAAYLHPDVQLFGGQGFEATDLPEQSYDLVISNVPFGNDKVFDPRMPEDYLTRTIHDYFLARALLLVRPGGLLALITSYGTLDKRDTRVRSWLAQRAELLRAVRLPHGTFRANAGTECGADLLIFRRATDAAALPAQPSWVETAWAQVPLVDERSTPFTFNAILRGGDIVDGRDGTAQLRLGRVFADQPEQIAGILRVVRDGEHLFSHVAAPADGAIGAALAERLAHLPADLILPAAPVLPTPETLTPATPAERAATTPRVAGLLAIYHAAKAVLRHDIHALDASEARVALNTVYDTFVAAFGPIHARPNQLALKGQPELLFLSSLECDVRHDPTSGTSARKAALFTQPTIRPTPRIVAGHMTPDEALLCCLDECGRVDLARIAQLCGLTAPAAASALTGRIYCDPATRAYCTADAYLSGNIRTKLTAAQHAALSDPHFTTNVSALQAVLPAPLTPGQITVTFGAPWVPPDIICAFITTLIPTFQGSRFAQGKVSYLRPLAKWVVSDDAYSRRSPAATLEWGTSRLDAIEIITKALNHQSPLIYDELEDGGRVLNHKETLLAREKLERITERWTAWVWADAERTERLATLYNELFNSTHRRDFDGAHLTLPGLNTTVLRGGDLAPHQKDAVWMILQVPSVLLDLCVGAGKTFICLAAAYELKRLGLAKKILITVPNHLTEQWAAEANRLYPQMRVLAMSPDDFAKAQRGTFLSRIATEEWDVIICAHTSFGFIEVGSTGQEFIRTEVSTLRTFLTELTAQQQRGESSRAERRSIKEIERKILALETRLKEREHDLAHDDARIITWEELGIDALFVDEAQEFKNLAIATGMGNIPGVPKGDSKRALDMRIKTWELRRRGGRVVFATGTPVLNTLGEVFIMQKFLQEEVLAAHGIEHFDAWASTFAQTQTLLEMTPDGGGFRLNTRLCTFVNLPELFTLWFQSTFSRSRAQLGLPTPQLVGGKPIALSVPGTPTLKRLVRSFVQRVEAIKSGSVEPTLDNMLCVTNDGRKAALDVRLVVGGPEEPVCKINLLVNTVAELHQRYAAARATQLIYCELSTPKPHATGDDIGDKNFVYHEIREKLVQRGIPRAQIAFIQEHTTKAKRAALFAAMNRGDVRVLLCSKQSTGMNIQQRLIALHNLDAPWRPGDLEQRIGRIERQGNHWPEVFVINYVTEGSFDGYLWQILETKARFIEQMRRGDVSMRVIDDISGAVLSAAEIKAIASGNPQIMRKVQLDAEVAKLDSLYSSYRDTQVRRRSALHDMAFKRERLSERQALLRAAQAVVAPFTDTPFRAALVTSLLSNDAVAYTKREAAGKVLRALVEQAVAAASSGSERIIRTLGSYCGLLLRVQASSLGLQSEVFLALDQDGTITPLSSTPLSYETDLGVFASIDSQIRGIADGLEAISSQFARMASDEAQIAAALEQPWDQADHAAQVRAELATLNAALSRADAGDPAAPPTETATTTATTNADTPTNESQPENAPLRVVAVSDAEADTLALPTPALTLPPALLPHPADAERMAAALVALAALDSLPLPVEIEVEAEGEADEETVQAATEDTATLEHAALPPEPTPTTPLLLTAQDTIRPSRTSTSTLVFGDPHHIRQVKPSKTRAARTMPPTLPTSDLFAPEPSAACQMALF